MIPDHDEAPILAAMEEARFFCVTHACGSCRGCKARDSSLLSRIADAEVANMHSRPCQVCSALRGMSEEARAGVEQALAGTIGERTLADILTDAGYPTGRRAVQNHRREAHTP